MIKVTSFGGRTIYEVTGGNKDEVVVFFKKKL